MALILPAMPRVLLVRTLLGLGGFPLQSLPFVYTTSCGAGDFFRLRGVLELVALGETLPRSSRGALGLGTWFPMLMGFVTGFLLALSGWSRGGGFLRRS
ncbi:hypothetical protein HOY80DRAFT_988275 [Tuber brumale]|nr:hypothetical protein HOY80DRAFT_988275 [Tuber brumale]